MSDERSTSPLAFIPPAGFNIERVFPIRNLVLNSPNPTSSPPDSTDAYGSQGSANGSNKSERQSPKLEVLSQREVVVEIAEKTKIPESDFLPPPWPEIPPLGDLRSIPTSDLDSENDSGGVESNGTSVSGRAMMVPATRGPPGTSHGIIPGNVTRRFFRCEDEPIRTPGAIQQFGALVASKYNAERDLQVRVASESTLRLLQHTPDQLFGLRCFLDIFDVDSQEEISSRIRHVLNMAASMIEEPAATKLEIVHVSLNASTGSQKGLWCAVSISAGTKDLVICEFEEYSEKFYLGDTYLEESLPTIPVCTVGIDIDPEELRKSHTRESQPLRVLEIARRRKEGTVPSIDVFGAMTDAQFQLANCVTVQQVLDVVVGIISELTGFHRVMFYRFDSMNNGCVDAEYVDPKASGDLFRGKFSDFVVDFVADYKSRFALSCFRYSSTSEGVV